MGKIRWHRGKKQEKIAKKLIKWAKETGISSLAIPAKVGQCRPWNWQQRVPIDKNLWKISWIIKLKSHIHLISLNWQWLQISNKHVNVSWLKQTDDYQLVPVSISPQILVARWESALMDEVANGRQKLTNSVATSTIILDRRIWQQLGLYPPATLQGDVRRLVGKYQLIYTVLQYCTAGICDICAIIFCLSISL